MQSDKVKNAKHFIFCICDSGTQKNSDRNLLEIGEIKNYCWFVFHIRTRSVQKTLIGNYENNQLLPKKIYKISSKKLHYLLNRHRSK